MEQYEKVVLEMLARIQKLEDEVAALKAAQTAPAAPAAEPAPAARAPRRTNSKVNEEMLDFCYRAGKKLYENEDLELRPLADAAFAKTGINRNTAVMYIYAVLSMLQGVVYKRSISARATEQIFRSILADYGDGKLQLAIASLRLHIAYRNAQNLPVTKLAALCDKYQALLDHE